MKEPLGAKRAFAKKDEGADDSGDKASPKRPAAAAEGNGASSAASGKKAKKAA